MANLFQTDEDIITSGNISGVDGIFSGDISAENLGEPNGIATLDSSGLVPASQIPPIAINEVYVVADQSARLALSANVGDIAKQTDTGVTYILQQLPASTNANWIVINAGDGTVTTVSVVPANGVSATIPNPSTTPAITFSLGAITPTSVAASSTVSGSNLSGTNTGDQTIIMTGAVTGSGTGTISTTLATVGVASGGTGVTSTTAYAVLCGGTTSTGALQSVAALGSSGNVLTSNGAGALPTFQAAGGGGITALTGDVTASGSGSVPATIPANTVTYAKIQQSAGTNVVLANPTNAVANYTEVALSTNQILGRGSSNIGALSLGTNLSISGSTLNAASGGTLPYTNVTSTSQTIAANNSYGANNASLVTFALPVSGISAGQVIWVTGVGAGGWKITQNSSQNIIFGNQSTTVGATGFISSTNANDSVMLECTVANTTFQVVAATGTITIGAGSGTQNAINSTDRIIRVLGTNVTPTTTSGTSETNLHSYTIPANTFINNGNFLEFEGFIVISGSGVGTNTLRMYANGTAVTVLTNTRALANQIWFRGILTQNGTSTLSLCVPSTVISTAATVINTSIAFNTGLSFVFKITGQAGTNDVMTAGSSYLRAYLI